MKLQVKPRNFYHLHGCSSGNSTFRKLQAKLLGYKPKFQNCKFLIKSEKIIELKKEGDCHYSGKMKHAIVGNMMQSSVA